MYCSDVFGYQPSQCDFRRSVTSLTGCLMSARGEISPEITCTRSATKPTSCGDGRRRRTVAPKGWRRRNRIDVYALNITTGPGRCRHSSSWLPYATTGKTAFHGEFFNARQHSNADARRAILNRNSLRPSVRLSRFGTVPKRLNISTFVSVLLAPPL